jgi:hypothetical protein
MEELEGMAGDDTAGDSVGGESGNNSDTQLQMAAWAVRPLIAVRLAKVAEVVTCE